MTDYDYKRLADALGVKPQKRDLFRRALDASRADGEADMIFFLMHLIARALSDMHGFGGGRILDTVQRIYDYAEQIRDDWMSLDAVADVLREEKGLVMTQDEGGITFRLIKKERKKNAP